MQSAALQRDGKTIIQKIDAALTNAYANYFVDCGTLLGMIRDKKLIQFDRDLDMGIWFNDSFGLPELDAAMKQVGYKKVSTSFYRGEPKEITYSKGVLHIDFFVHTEVGNESWLYVFYRNALNQYPSNKHYSLIVQKRAHIPNVKRVTIEGITMNIPENTEEYLESAYSDKWRIPDPDWRYTMEPGCTFIDNEYGIKEIY